MTANSDTVYALNVARIVASLKESGYTKDAIIKDVVDDYDETKNVKWQTLFDRMIKLSNAQGDANNQGTARRTRGQKTTHQPDVAFQAIYDEIEYYKIVNTLFASTYKEVKDFVQPFKNELKSKTCSPKLKPAINAFLEKLPNKTNLSAYKGDFEKLLQALKHFEQSGCDSMNPASSDEMDESADVESDDVKSSDESDVDFLESFEKEDARKIKDVHDKITWDNAWDQWPLQIISSTAYQKAVKDYIEIKDLDFVDTETPVDELNGYHCLLDPRFLAQANSEDYQYMAVHKFVFEYPGVLIPCRIKKCNVKERYMVINKKHTYKLVPETKLNYALAIHWTDLPRFLQGEPPAVVADYIKTDYDLSKKVGFQAYDFDSGNTLRELRQHLIDPLERIRLCSNSVEDVSVPRPLLYMQNNPELITSYVVADTYHDFGQTQYQTTFVDQVLVGKYKKVLHYVKPKKSTVTYGPAGFSDRKYVSYVTKQYLVTDENKPVNLNPVTYDSFRKGICKELISSVSARETEFLRSKGKVEDANQIVLNTINNNKDNTKIFVNRGASQQIFKRQQRICAASRFDGTIRGKYIGDVDKDSGYGFNSDELMFFDKIFVRGGDIYVVKNQNVSKLSFECHADKNKKGEKYLTWLHECLCDTSLQSLPQPIPEANENPVNNDIALAFYDLKRIADGLVIKAALHYNEVMITHDKLALIGARLYGCPVIFSNKNESLYSFPRDAKHNPALGFYESRKLRHESEPPASTQDVNTPKGTMSDFAQSVCYSNAATTVVFQATGIETPEDEPMDVEQENIIPPEPVVPQIPPAPVVPQIPPQSNKRPYRVMAPVPPQGLVEQNYNSMVEAANVDMARYYCGVARKYLGLNLASNNPHKYRKIEGGATFITFRNPSRFLIGCLTELLVLMTFSKENRHSNGRPKHDFVAEVIEECLTTRSQYQYASATMEKQLMAEILELLQHIYAQRFGIVTPADHAFKVFTDPHLSLGQNMNVEYYNKLNQVVKRIQKSRVKTGQPANDRRVHVPLQALSLSVDKPKPNMVSKPANASAPQPLASSTKGRVRSSKEHVDIPIPAIVPSKVVKGESSKKHVSQTQKSASSVSPRSSKTILGQVAPSKMVVRSVPTPNNPRVPLSRKPQSAKEAKKSTQGLPQGVHRAMPERGDKNVTLGINGPKGVLVNLS